MKISTLEDVFSYIESFTNLEKSVSLFNARSYRLDRMRILLEHFGNPHESYQVLHVAGTKGKGSTAAFLASILNAAGCRTGLYTSPHVTSYCERISVPSLPPGHGEKLFIRLGNQIKEAVNHIKNRLPAYELPTTFELLTLLGFCYFREIECLYAVVETGIGGRLDATNLVKPDLCVITPIELEHTDILGNTLESIAREKGGIIKPGVPVFSGFQDLEVKDILQNISGNRGAEIFFLDEETETLNAECTPFHTVLEVQIKGERAKRFTLSLLGEFQAENAALAYLSLKFCFKLPESAFEKGFREAFLPGRMEVISREPFVVIDGAHTPRSIQRILAAFQKLSPSWRSKAILLFGSVSGKKPKEMAEILAPAFEKIIITTPGDFKESNPEEIHRIFKAINPGAALIKDPIKAFKKALFLSENRIPILITGSFYLAGEIKRYFQNPGQPHHP